MNSAGIDPERPGGHIFIVFGFGMHKEGKGIGIAHQHALATAEQGNCVGANPVAKANRLNARNPGRHKILLAASYLALPDNFANFGSPAACNDNCVNAFLENA